MVENDFQEKAAKLVLKVPRELLLNDHQDDEDAERSVECHVIASALKGEEFNAAKDAGNSNIKAEFLAWWLTTPCAAKKIHRNGLRLKNLSVIGFLDLAGIKFQRPLMFRDCVFKSGADFSLSELLSLDLKCCEFGDLPHANQSDQSSNVDSSPQAKPRDAPLRLRNAKISGDLILSGCKICGRHVQDETDKFLPGFRCSLVADGMSLDGDFIADSEFKAFGTVDIRGATLKGVLQFGTAHLDGCGREALRADRLRCSSNVYLINGFRSDGTVSFTGARIEGRFNGNGGTFYASRRNVLNTYGIGKRESGPDQHSGRNSTVVSAKPVGGENNVAIRLTESQISKHISLSTHDSSKRRCKVWGEVDISGAHVGGSLIFKHGIFSSGKYYHFAPIITCDRITINGSVFFDGKFIARGQIRFPAAEIQNNFYLQGSVLAESLDEAGVFLNGMHVKGTVFLSDYPETAASMKIVRIRGHISLIRAVVGGDVSLEGAELGIPKATGDNESQDVGLVSLALIGNGMEVGGSLLLRDPRFREYKPVPSRPRDTTGSAVTWTFRPFIAHGEVRIIGARVGGNLSLRGAKLHGSPKAIPLPNHRRGSYALDLTRTVVGGALRIDKFADPPEGHIDLTHAVVAHLSDDKNSWPQHSSEQKKPDDGNVRYLLIDNFRYESLGRNAPKVAEDRKEWLELQPPDEFHSFPYEQLSSVLHRMGRTRDAHEILLYQQGAYRRRIWKELFDITPHHTTSVSGDIREEEANPEEWKADIKAKLKSDWDCVVNFLKCLWLGFLHITVGFGFRPQRPLFFLVALWLFGAFIFGGYVGKDHFFPTKLRSFVHVVNDQKQSMVPYLAKGVRGVPEVYPHFDKFAYSFDLMMPYFDLHQDSYWDIRHDQPDSKLLRRYQLFHTIASQIALVLLVISPFKLMRRLL